MDVHVCCVCVKLVSMIFIMLGYNTCPLFAHFRQRTGAENLFRYNHVLATYSWYFVYVMSVQDMSPCHWLF